MQLTHAQEAMSAAIEDQWLAAAMETGSASRAAAESGVREAYRLAGATPPDRIFWLGSPRAGAAAAALLSGASLPSAPTSGAPSLSAPTPGALTSGTPSLSAPTPGALTSGTPSLSAPTPGAPTSGTPSFSAPTSSAPLPGASSHGAPWAGAPSAGALSAGLPSPGALSAGVPFPTAPSPSGQPAWLAEMYEELRRQGWTPGETGGASLRRRVRTEPWAVARQAAVAALGGDGWAQLGAAAGRRSWPLVMDLVAGRLRLRLSEDLAADFPGAAGRPLRTAVLDAIYGQHDGTWLATFEAADRLAPGIAAPLSGLAAVARHAGWWWATERFAVLTERPASLTRDNVGRLHRGEGPAMEFPDGYGLWAWRGMPIPPELVAELPTLTVARIQKEENAELRRVMLEHFGYERYLREAGAHNLGSDETGTLWRLDLSGDEPLVMVEVVNSTPEPDGTSRVYWLRVPPQTSTAREGVAWTFGLTAAEYRPSIQT